MQRLKRLLLIVTMYVGVGSIFTRTAQAEGQTQPKTPRRLTQGEVLYLRHCADCHGWEAQGDGPLAQVLVVKPRNLRQQHDLFTNNTDADVALRILAGQPLPVPVDPAALRYTDAELTALMAHLQRLPTLTRPEVATGKQVYDSLCAACHGLYGRGDGLGARHLAVPPRDLHTLTSSTVQTDDEIVQLITNGKGAMPGMGDVLSAHEIRAVVSFLRILSPGYELYDRFCARCHGTDGDPVNRSVPARDTPTQKMPPRLDAAYLAKHSDNDLRSASQHFLKQSRPAMPHFSGQLSADEVLDIVHYLRTLPPEP